MEEINLMVYQSFQKVELKFVVLDKPINFKELLSKVEIQFSFRVKVTKGQDFSHHVCHDIPLSQEED